MREVVFDTETTGFNPFTGDRLVEIGCVEVENFLPTGRIFHQYINPERDMPEGAFRIHGLSREYLTDFPVFSEIYPEFIDFVGTAKLIAHNADFDMKFINWELSQVGQTPIPSNQAIDTLEIARRKFPGASNSLDALCKRFSINNLNRVKHGALLDAELLAEVYLELMGGRQCGFALSGPEQGPEQTPEQGPEQTPEEVPEQKNAVSVKISRNGRSQYREIRLHAATKEELDRHKIFITGMESATGQDALWNKNK